MAKALVALIVSLFLAFPSQAAQSRSEAKKAPTPAWTALTSAQQKVLSPLQGEWEQLDTVRRKKWVSIADRYPTMKPAQQQRLQKRMEEWALLSPAERKVAREKYQTIKKLPPQKRNEVKQRWEEYEHSRTPAPAPAAADTPPG